MDGPEERPPYPILPQLLPQLLTGDPVIQEFLKVFLPTLDYLLSGGQQSPTLTVHSLDGSPFPLLRCRMVFQKHFGADRESFSMTSPSFSHTRCSASDTAAAAALRARRYPAAGQESSGITSSSSVKWRLLVFHHISPPTGLLHRSVQQGRWQMIL